eukprot:TRINITY_DN46840_c0_g1_i1.p1 TRINITY_DN46840_c0_g1~~TRINITY_DN46840_c0_g1_i1.p1  ORF type:complete len:458 (+),score=70.75 TRINITY_DN46840_c0_g1_i1:136-1509(+)
MDTTSLDVSSSAAAAHGGDRPHHLTPLRVGGAQGRGFEGHASVGSPLGSTQSPRLEQQRQKRLAQESEVLSEIRARMEAREAEMARIDADVHSRQLGERQRGTDVSMSTATAFGGPVPAAAAAGMPLAADPAAYPRYPSRGSPRVQSPHRSPRSPGGFHHGGFGRVQGSPKGGQMYSPADSSPCAQAFGSPSSDDSPLVHYQSRGSAPVYITRAPPAAQLASRRGGDHAESTLHPESTVHPWQGDGSPQRRTRGVAEASGEGYEVDEDAAEKHDDSSSSPWSGIPMWWYAVAVGSGLVVGGCGGWLLGYAIYGPATKGLAAKAVMAGTGGGHAAPVAVSAAAAGATSSASLAASTKGSATMSAAATQSGATLQQAIPSTLTSAEAAAATAAQGSFEAAGAATLATPYITPAVAGSAGAGAGSIAIGAAVGGTAAGAAAVAVSRPKAAPRAMLADGGG